MNILDEVYIVENYAVFSWTWLKIENGIVMDMVMCRLRLKGVSSCFLL